MEKKQFKVEGMKCVHCKANVETAVRAVKGVESAEVTLEGGLLTVVRDAAVATDEAIKQAVEENGRYEVVG